MQSTVRIAPQVATASSFPYRSTSVSSWPVTVICSSHFTWTSSGKQPAKLHSLPSTAAEWFALTMHAPETQSQKLWQCMLLKQLQKLWQHLLLKHNQRNWHCTLLKHTKALTMHTPEMHISSDNARSWNTITEKMSAMNRSLSTHCLPDPTTSQVARVCGFLTLGPQDLQCEWPMLQPCPHPQTVEADVETHFTQRWLICEHYLHSAMSSFIKLLVFFQRKRNATKMTPSILKKRSGRNSPKQTQI